MEVTWIPTASQYIVIVGAQISIYGIGFSQKTDFLAIFPAKMIV
jgi:hypothetical protein